jgi:hypothetical protein
MMQSTESIVRNHAPGICGTNPPSRSSLPWSEMRTVLVVIVNVVEKKSLQMPFVHSKDMIQQFPPTAFDPALRHPVLPWTLERGLDRLNPEGSHGSRSLHSVVPRHNASRSWNQQLTQRGVTLLQASSSRAQLSRMEFLGSFPHFIRTRSR